MTFLFVFFFSFLVVVVVLYSFFFSWFVLVPSFLFGILFFVFFTLPVLKVVTFRLEFYTRKRAFNPVMRHQLHNQADRGAVNESEGVLFPLHHNQIEFCGLIDFDSTCH